MTTQSTAPVFVIGCPRSGTTLLYHMLVSAGGFANYRAETHLFSEVLPYTGNLHRARARERLLARWLTSPRFTVSGLVAEDFARTVRTECRSNGNFLRLFMGAIADRQGVCRWAECTPAHALHMDEIRRAIPDALFVHIIRDGRDVALSLSRLGWVRPLPWDRHLDVDVAAWTWDWHVRRARLASRRFGDAYAEVRFEDLVQSPESTLARLGDFVGETLDLGRIRTAGVGSVSAPNTAFGDGDVPGPIGRWRTLLTPDQVASLDGTVGPLLRELGYETAESGAWARALHVRRAFYQAYRSAKLALKTRTPLGRILTRPQWDEL